MPAKSLYLPNKMALVKDYYYFLGIAPGTSDDEIKRAYRKLSLKYHPDKNENDAFFSARFREAQEAYETLTDAERRKNYDALLEGRQKSTRTDLPPFIKNFHADKVRAKKGDEVTVSWQTTNADVVKILPFGLEKPFGERIFRITEFRDGKFDIVLQAHNSLINKSVVKGITITEVFDSNDSSEPENNEATFKHKYTPRKNRRKLSGLRIVSLIVIAIILLVLAFSTMKF